MNISYDNQKIADLIKALILKANDVAPSTGMEQSSRGDVENYLKQSYDPLFLNNTSFYDNYTSFQNTLSDIVQDNIVNKGKGLKFNKIIDAYNKLIRYIESGLNYNTMSSSEKAIVDREMTKLITDVQAVKSLTGDKGSSKVYNIALHNI